MNALINVDHLSLLSLLSDSEGTAMCEIVHTRSESEGRPERTFQLCCRYDCFVFILFFIQNMWTEGTRYWTKDFPCKLSLRFCAFVQSAVLQIVRRTSWKQSTPSSGRSSAGSFLRRSLCHPTSSMSHLGANVCVPSKGRGPLWTKQVTKLKYSF